MSVTASPPPIPTWSEVVADLLKARRIAWPEPLDANLYQLRVMWGHLKHLSPAPWCIHGRLMSETCNQCNGSLS